MKSNRFMQRGFTLTLCLMVSLLVGAQTPKKPRMQTSASPKETISLIPQHYSLTLFISA